MDIGYSSLTALTLSSIIVTGGLTINLTENFGNLANSGSVQQELDGSKLIGNYGNAETVMSALTISLCGLYLIIYMYQWYKRRNDKTASFQRIYYLIILLAVLLGISSAAVNLNLTTNYTQITDLSTSPSPVVPGENYKLRGAYGTATLGMAISSTAMASIGFLWLMHLFRMNWNTMQVFSLETGLTSSSRKTRNEPLTKLTAL
jgi:hypothetical protein